MSYITIDDDRIKSFSVDVKVDELLELLVENNYLGDIMETLCANRDNLDECAAWMIEKLRNS